MAYFKLSLQTLNANKMSLNQNGVQSGKFVPAVMTEFDSEQPIERGLCYTYEESLSIHNNAQKELSFKLDRMVLDGDEWVENPFAPHMHIGTQLLLQDKYGNEFFFTIKDISYSFSSINTVYSISCQDTFTYQHTRQNDGYEIVNDPSSADFIGAKTIDYWASKVHDECHSGYDYIPLNVGLYVDKLGNIIPFTNKDNLSNENANEVLKVIKECYPVPSEVNNFKNKDLYETFAYAGSGNANSVLIELGEKISMSLCTYEHSVAEFDDQQQEPGKADQKGINKDIVRYFWYEPSKSDRDSGLVYSPYDSLQSFSLTHSGDALTTVMNVNGPTYGDEMITLLPSITPFYNQLFQSNDWLTSSYAPGYFMQAAYGKVLTYKKTAVLKSDFVINHGIVDGTSYYDKNYLLNTFALFPSDYYTKKAATDDGNNSYTNYPYIEKDRLTNKSWIMLPIRDYNKLNASIFDQFTFSGLYNGVTFNNEVHKTKETSQDIITSKVVLGHYNINESDTTVSAGNLETPVDDTNEVAATQDSSSYTFITDLNSLDYTWKLAIIEDYYDLYHKRIAEWSNEQMKHIYKSNVEVCAFLCTNELASYFDKNVNYKDIISSIDNKTLVISINKKLLDNGVFNEDEFKDTNIAQLQGEYRDIFRAGWIYSHYNSFVDKDGDTIIQLFYVGNEDLNKVETNLDSGDKKQLAFYIDKVYRGFNDVKVTGEDGDLVCPFDTNKPILVNKELLEEVNETNGSYTYAAFIYTYCNGKILGLFKINGSENTDTDYAFTYTPVKKKTIVSTDNVEQWAGKQTKNAYIIIQVDEDKIFSDKTDIEKPVFIFDENIYLNFYRSPTQNDIDFATAADQIPWLENKLIDFSYFYKHNILTKNDYITLLKQIQDNLRITNGRLLCYTNDYYEALRTKTTTLAELSNSIDSIGAAFNANVISPYASNGKVGDTTQFDNAYNSIYNNFDSSEKSQLSILSYDETVSDYMNKYISTQQRFLKNMNEFKKYFNAPVSFFDSTSCLYQDEIQLLFNPMNSSMRKGDLDESYILTYATFADKDSSNGEVTFKAVDQHFNLYKNDLSSASYGEPNTPLYYKDENGTIEMVDVVHGGNYKNYNHAFYVNKNSPDSKKYHCFELSNNDYNPLETYYRKVYRLNLSDPNCTLNGKEDLLNTKDIVIQTTLEDEQKTVINWDFNITTEETKSYMNIRRQIYGLYEYIEERDKDTNTFSNNWVPQEMEVITKEGKYTLSPEEFSIVYEEVTLEDINLNYAKLLQVNKLKTKLPRDSHQDIGHLYQTPEKLFEKTYSETYSPVQNLFNSNIQNLYTLTSYYSMQEINNMSEQIRDDRTQRFYVLSAYREGFILNSNISEYVQNLPINQLYTKTLDYVPTTDASNGGLVDYRINNSKNQTLNRIISMVKANAIDNISLINEKLFANKSLSKVLLTQSANSNSNSNANEINWSGGELPAKSFVDSSIIAKSSDKNNPYIKSVNEVAKPVPFVLVGQNDTAYVHRDSQNTNNWVRLAFSKNSMAQFDVNGRPLFLGLEKNSCLPVFAKDDASYNTSVRVLKNEIDFFKKIYDLRKIWTEKQVYNKGTDAERSIELKRLAKENGISFNLTYETVTNTISGSGFRDYYPENYRAYVTRVDSKDFEPMNEEEARSRVNATLVFTKGNDKKLVAKFATPISSVSDEFIVDSTAVEELVLAFVVEVRFNLDKKMSKYYNFSNVFYYDYQSMQRVVDAKVDQNNDINTYYDLIKSNNGDVEITSLETKVQTFNKVFNHKNAQTNYFYKDSWLVPLKANDLINKTDDYLIITLESAEKETIKAYSTPKEMLKQYETNSYSMNFRPKNIGWIKNTSTNTYTDVITDLHGAFNINTVGLDSNINDTRFKISAIANYPLLKNSKHLNVADILVNEKSTMQLKALLKANYSNVEEEAIAPFEDVEDGFLNYSINEKDKPYLFIQERKMPDEYGKINTFTNFVIIVKKEDYLRSFPFDLTNSSKTTLDSICKQKTTSTFKTAYYDSASGDRITLYNQDGFIQGFYSNLTADIIDTGDDEVTVKFNPDYHYYDKITHQRVYTLRQLMFGEAPKRAYYINNSSYKEMNFNNKKMNFTKEIELHQNTFKRVYNKLSLTVDCLNEESFNKKVVDFNKAVVGTRLTLVSEGVETPVIVTGKIYKDSSDIIFTFTADGDFGGNKVWDRDSDWKLLLKSVVFTSSADEDGVISKTLELQRPSSLSNSTETVVKFTANFTASNVGDKEKLGGTTPRTITFVGKANDESSVKYYLTYSIRGTKISDIGANTNGSFWFLYRNSIEYPTLLEHAAGIETQLQQYWGTAYASSMYCEYFLPEHWQSTVEGESNAFSKDIMTPIYTKVNGVDKLDKVTLNNTYIPDVAIVNDGSQNINLPKYKLTYHSNIKDYFVNKTNGSNFAIDNYISNLSYASQAFKNNLAITNIFDGLSTVAGENGIASLSNWSAEKMGTTTTNYYYAVNGGLLRSKAVNFLKTNGRVYNYFIGIYPMIVIWLAKKYHNRDLSSYTRYKRDHDRIWQSLYNNYPTVLLESKFDDGSTATTSAELMILAKNTFADLSNPEQSYNVTVIENFGSPEFGYCGQELKIGDGIRVNANELVGADDINDDLHKSLNKWLFISDIKYNLRTDTDISLTVNTVKYKDKIIKRLAKLIK